MTRNDNELERIGATYTLVRKGDRWLITVLIAHAPEFGLWLDP
ncbi:MAG: hypothetical protein ACR2QV_15150 [Gammaproteobacteria bacterium]